MNPIFNERVVKHEVYHKDYNLDKKDNLDELPEGLAIFGIFGIIQETPIHPRYIISTDNLRQQHVMYLRIRKKKEEKNMQCSHIQVL